MKLDKVGKALSLVAFVAIIAGCSSSSDDGTVSENTEQSGVFVDSFVAGLDYNCDPDGNSDRYGVTDAEGKFRYKSGDSCVFSVADMDIGETAGKSVITPLDFLDSNSQDRLVNTLMLLQALDSVGDLNDGIQIPEGLTGYVDESIVSSSSDWLVELDRFLDGNGIQRHFDENDALTHFYDVTNGYFQTALTEAMFNDRQIIFEHGIVILKENKDYEIALYNNAEPCQGTWSVEGTALHLSQATCGFGLDLSNNVEITVVDFDALPEAGAHFRARVGVGPYDYAFERVGGVEPSTAPAAPSNPGAGYAATTSSVSIRWNDNSTNETSFQVLYNTTGDFSGVNGYQYVMASGNSTGNMTLGGLPENTTYYFQVRAWNALGVSDLTETYSATTLQTIPAAPSGLGFASIALYGTYSLVWTDNSNSEENFVLESSDSESFASVTTSTYGPDVEQSETFNNKASGSTWYFRVKATNSNGDSEYSNVYSHTF